jgi:hypothetical protein
MNSYSAMRDELGKIAGALDYLKSHLPSAGAEHATDLLGLGMMAAGSGSHLRSQLSGQGEGGGPISPAGQAGMDLAGLGVMAAPTVAELSSWKHHVPAGVGHAGGGSRWTNIANLAGLSALAVPTLDKLQANIRARRAGVDPETKMLLGHKAHKALELGGYGALAAPLLAQGRGMGLGGLSQLAGYGVLAAPTITNMKEGPGRTSSELAGLGLLAAPTAIGMLRGHH